MSFSESTYYGDEGLLYPFDIRHESHNRAFCNPLPNDRVQICLHTEKSFREANLVYNDGAAHVASMYIDHQDRRFFYWETYIRPKDMILSYSFALKTIDGESVYFSRQGIDRSTALPHRWVLNRSEILPLDLPGWAQGALIYQIFPERFANGNLDNDPPETVSWGSPPHWLEFQGGDLEGILARVDYLHDLGVDILYLNPIFASPSTHKYDTVDYYRVDPGFGSKDTLRKLVDALHQRHMRIILDASFNHCHPRFFAFQDLIRNGKDSSYRDWFTINEFPIQVRYRPHLFAQMFDDPKDPYAQWFEQFKRISNVPIMIVEDDGPLLEPSYLTWNGVPDMPKLNLKNPETRSYFMDVAVYWLSEFNIDGWRMDVTRHIDFDFWMEFRRVTKAVKPECYLLCEVYGDATLWLNGNQFDGTMNYSFRFLCIEYFVKESIDTIQFLDGLTRILSRYPFDIVSVSQNLLSSHDTERFLYVSNRDSKRMYLATLLQLTMPGAPSIYYGDEVGMTGGRDPDCRRAFPWHQPKAWDQEMLTLTRTLANLRREFPSLRFGKWHLTWNNDEAFAFVRSYAQEQVLVLINRNLSVASVELPLLTNEPRVLWGSAHVRTDSRGLIIESIEPWSGSIILL